MLTSFYMLQLHVTRWFECVFCQTYLHNNLRALNIDMQYKIFLNILKANKLCIFFNLSIRIRIKDTDNISTVYCDKNHLGMALVLQTDNDISLTASKQKL